MERLRKYGFGLALLALSIAWFGCIKTTLRELCVELVFEAGQTGRVALVEVCEGRSAREAEAVVIKADGRVRFKVNRRAKTFYFKLFPTHDRKAFRLLEMRFMGFPLLTAETIPRFEMRKRLYSELPRSAGEPLLLMAGEGDALDLPNVFPYVQRFFVTGSQIMAWGPLALVVMVLLGTVVMKCWGRCLSGLMDRPFVYIAFVVLTLLLSLPMPVACVSPGLDPSWVWLFNRYAFSGAIGRDFVFTYGPLGFLISPQLNLLNVMSGIVVNFAFTVVFGLCLAILFLGGSGSDERRTAWLLPVLWVLPWPNGMEWKWMAVSLTLAVLPAFVGLRLRSSVRCSLVAMTALSAAFLSYVKFSSCLVVVGQHVFLLTYMAWNERGKSMLCLGAYALFFLCAAGVGALFLFPSASDWVAWIKGSVEIATGYNLYMGGDKSFFELALPFAVLAGVFVTGVVSGVGWRRGAVYWFVLSPTVFCLFKYAVVRQSVIPMALILAWGLFLQIACRRGRGLRQVVGGFALVVLALTVDIVFCGGVPRSGLSFQNVLDTCCPWRALARARAKSKPELEKMRLPVEWRIRIGTNLVMIAGWEMAPAMSEDLNLVPFPAAQTYSAYTPYLDWLCADRIRRETDAVRFLLVPADPWTFDSRNLYFDNPRLWTAVRENFAYVAADAHHVFLERKEGSSRSDETGVAKRMRRTSWGRLMAFFFRPDRARAHMLFRSGRQYGCSANPEVLDGVICPTDIPIARDEVPAFFGAGGEVQSIESWRVQANENQLEVQ